MKAVIKDGRRRRNALHQAMLDDGLEPSQVAKLTGLSLRQLAKLRH